MDDHEDQAIDAVFNGVEALIDLVKTLFDPVKTLFDPVKALFDPVKTLFDPVEALFDPVEALFDSLEPLIHFRAQFCHFRAQFRELCDHEPMHVLHHRLHLKKLKLGHRTVGVVRMLRLHEGGHLPCGKWGARMPGRGAPIE
ncbi:hypothetical protein [Tumebacillus flagellatus]|uniref:Uncharacterized protein n=1 Tax=Tumebacillus flagellatus TaxID=1157490 RepID=A0A074LSB3_9BACL|nr:hypothetical protein [Tumebacillus flagellatus]KEO85026.1 hypothetical protein EL26_00215 [Tumebacillus flagellatus]